MASLEDLAEIGSRVGSIGRSLGNAARSLQNASNTNVSENPRDVYRYPYAAIDKSTDLLSIKIFDFQKKGDIFGLGTDGNLVEKLTSLSSAADPIENLKLNTEQGKKLATESINIYLPIPQNVSDSLEVAYEDDTLNPLQVASMNIVASGVKDSKQAATDLINGFGDIGLNAGLKSALITVLSGKALNSAGANVSPEALITRSTGQIFQSNLELLFSGVTLRSFPFTFDFAPRDQREANEVMNIIRVFKKSMSPKKGANPSVFINSPKYFKFEYISGNNVHPFLNKFKTGVLTRMSVNYTASGTYATYSDGAPVHIKMECTLKEINPIYAEDYDSSVSKGGVGY
jgi:hypothetical protein